MTKTSAPLPEFQRFQYAFSAHIRDPKANPRPRGVEARRMRIYNELLYNNIESFLLSCFPVLHQVLGRQKWARLVRTFFSTHRSHTPYFRQIPDEFIQFLQTEWERPNAYPEYLLELAHYEWIELVLSVSNRAPDWCSIERDGDLLEGIPILNPLLANLRYTWPVHRIRPRFRPSPAETYLLVFRDADDQVQFSEINAFTARLLSLIETGTLSGRMALETITRESGHPKPETVIQGGLAVMQDLHTRGALLGACRTGSRFPSSPTGS